MMTEEFLFFGDIIACIGWFMQLVCDSVSISAIYISLYYILYTIYICISNIVKVFDYGYNVQY